MPLHDVKCSKCGHIQEFLYQPGSKPKTYICNHCDKIQDFKPLLSPPRIVMAGTRPIEKELEKDAADGVF
tara:strand:+ start:6251 stop:6460 length:210 start_codon:yes stop_codon:yes gene_type:complete